MKPMHLRNSKLVGITLPAIILLTALLLTACPEVTEEPADPSLPGAPINLILTPGSAESKTMTVTWTSPGSFGKKPDGTDDTLAEYKVYYSANNDFSNLESAQVIEATAGNPTTDNSYEVTGLTPGNTYYFMVVAINSQGKRTASIPKKGRATPNDVGSDAPTHLTATPAPDIAGITGRMMLKWNKPSNTGYTGGYGSTGTISSYTVYYSQNSDFSDLEASTISKTETGKAYIRFEITGLTDARSWNFVVTATTEEGEGAISNMATGTTDASAVALVAINATQPGNFNVVPGNERATVTWTESLEPGIHNGIVATSITYTVSWFKLSDSLVVERNPDPSNPLLSIDPVIDGSKSEITGLVNNIQYIVTILAHNHLPVTNEETKAAQIKIITPKALE